MTAAASIAAVQLDLGTQEYPELSQMLAYWTEKCRGRFAPRRADIDPIEFVSSLSRITLSDVLRDESGTLDFRYRLCGTQVCTTVGPDPTGRRPIELQPAEYGQMLHDHYSEAVRRRAPMLHLITAATREMARSYVRLLLPLSEDGVSVTMLMTVDSKQRNTQELRDILARLSQQKRG